MFAYAHSNAGLVELNNIYFKADNVFKAGNYIIMCRDVTKGLPPRKKMKNTKLLLKLVNLDPPEDDKQAATNPTSKDGGKKKKS